MQLKTYTFTPSEMIIIRDALIEHRQAFETTAPRRAPAGHRPGTRQLLPQS